MDLSWAELMVVGIVALIVIGPKDLPGMFRELGRFTAKLRAMGREFSRAMEQAAKESGIKDVAEDLKKATSDGSGRGEIGRRQVRKMGPVEKRGQADGARCGKTCDSSGCGGSCGQCACGCGNRAGDGCVGPEGGGTQGGGLGSRGEAAQGRRRRDRARADTSTGTGTETRGPGAQEGGKACG